MFYVKKNWKIWLAILTIPVFLVFSCGDSDDDGEESDDDWGDDDNGGDDDYGNDFDDFMDALPDPETMRLTLPGSDKSQTKTLGQLATLYDATVDYTRDLNFYVLEMLSFIDEITSYPYTSFNGEELIWGPWDPGGLSPVMARFTMTNAYGDHFNFTWEWRDKDSQSEDDWQVIWFGEVDASEGTQRRGVGYFQIDYTAAVEMDPTWDVLGEIRVDYDTITDGREIVIEFINFWPEDGTEAVNGDYFYHEHDDYSGEFLFDVFADIHDEEYHGQQYAEVEHFYFNTRWQGDGHGRSDVLVTEGDLPDMTPALDSAVLSECWDDQFARVYYVEEVTLASGPTVTVIEEGNPADCTFSQSTPQAD